MKDITKDLLLSLIADIEGPIMTEKTVTVLSSSAHAQVFTKETSGI